MSDLLAIGRFVIDWLFARNAKRSARVDEYLQEIQARCRELVEIDDLGSDRAALLHEQLKVLYEQASQRLPPSLVHHEGWNLYRALSSARIYFWLRSLESAMAAGQLEALLAERRTFSSPSFDALLQMLPVDRGDLGPKTLAGIRGQCLKDIARVLELRPFF